MYFEPAKKTYYRFPSANSITKMDNRMYFAEKPSHAKEYSHDNHQTNVHTPEIEHSYDFK